MYKPTAAVVTFVLVLLRVGAPVHAQDAGTLISEASVRGHLEFLAGDALNGRGSGTRDEWIAASYIASQLRRWGIEPLGDNGGYVQQVDVERSEASAPPVLTFEGGTLTHGKEMLVQFLSAASIRGPLFKYTPGATVPAGAVVLMPTPAPPNTGAAVAGASAVLVSETPESRGRWNAFGARLPATPARLVGVSATDRPTAVIVDTASYAAMSKLAAGSTNLADSRSEALAGHAHVECDRQDHRPQRIACGGGDPAHRPSRSPREPAP